MQNSKSVVQFLLVDFGWWVTIPGMDVHFRLVDFVEGCCCCDGGDTKSTPSLSDWTGV